MICASELLEAYTDEEINHATKIVYETASLNKRFSLTIVSSDISDIELQMLNKDKPTMTFKDILDEFMKDMVVGSTEISLRLDGDDKRELEIVSISEEAIIVTAL